MPKEKPVFIDPGLVEKWIMEFGAFGAHSGTGVWRTVYSPEWVAATDAFENWGRDAGLAMRRDAVGNVWARLEGKEDGSAVVSGSKTKNFVASFKNPQILAVLFRRRFPGPIYL